MGAPGGNLAWKLDLGILLNKAGAGLGLGKFGILPGSRPDQGWIKDPKNKSPEDRF